MGGLSNLLPAGAEQAVTYLPAHNVHPPEPCQSGWVVRAGVGQRLLPQLPDH